MKFKQKYNDLHWKSVFENVVHYLTHWGRVTNICISKLSIISSDNGLSLGRRQAIIWTNAGILLIRTIGTNFSEIVIAILTFQFRKMRLKVSSAKRQPFCLGLNVLTASPFCPGCFIVAYSHCHVPNLVVAHTNFLSDIKELFNRNQFFLQGIIPTQSGMSPW